MLSKCVLPCSLKFCWLLWQSSKKKYIPAFQVPKTTI
uniref:Uncharacterized protein n=1 Tax=Anguilla anguilla TaxID=7936 RepID=A0A0E9W7L6_ANGAN